MSPVRTRAIERRRSVKSAFGAGTARLLVHPDVARSTSPPGGRAGRSWPYARGRYHCGPPAAAARPADGPTATASPPACGGRARARRARLAPWPRDGARPGRRRSDGRLPSRRGAPTSRGSPSSSPRATGPRSPALGCVAALEAAGPGRFARGRRALARARRRRGLRRPTAPRGAGPVAVGGFAFAPRRRRRPALGRASRPPRCTCPRSRSRAAATRCA